MSDKIKDFSGEEIDEVSLFDEVTDETMEKAGDSKAAKGRYPTYTFSVPPCC